MALTLVIGNRNYSSWSLRAWLCLRASGVAFEEIRLALFDEAWKSAIARYSPAGRVPVLLDGDLRVWDTMAIIAHLRERVPDAPGWPRDAAARAWARSVCGEMHAGFLAVRDELPMNIRARRVLPMSGLSADARRQIGRIQEIWQYGRRRFGPAGPWLCGEFSLADVMYAPVATRFRTYGIPLHDEASAFVETIEAHPHVSEWTRAAQVEKERIGFIDDLVPARETQLTLG